jgi:glutaredoxin
VPVPHLFIDGERVAGGDDLDDMAAEVIINLKP